MHSDDDDRASFERWCVRMCVSRLKRRLRLGLPLSPVARRTLARFGIPGFVATFVERPDATGRWAQALTLLLDAGREAVA